MSSFIHHMLSNHLITALLRAAQTKYLPANPNGFRGIITASRRAIFTVSQVHWIAVCREDKCWMSVFVSGVSLLIFLVDIQWIATIWEKAKLLLYENHRACSDYHNHYRSKRHFHCKKKGFDGFISFEQKTDSFSKVMNFY